MDGNFHISGLISGFQTDDIIQKLMSISQVQVTNLQSQKTIVTGQKTAYSDLNAQLLGLDTVALRLSKPESFQLKTAQSSEPDALTVTTSADAISGQFQMSVQKLAQAHQVLSQGYAAAEDPLLGTGSLTIKVGAASYPPITLTADNNSLNGLAKAINDAGIPVKATVVNDGTSEPYRLVLTSTRTGSAQTITLDSGLEGGTGPTFTTLQAAQDAVIRLGDGTGSSLDLTSDTNTFDGAIPGVTLDLKKADPGVPLTVTVQNDVNGVKGMINSFVSSYNQAADFFANNMYYEPSTQKAGPLQGDFTAAQIRSTLGDLVISSSGSGSLRGLADIGITIDKTGHLNVSDATALNKALQTNWDGVSSMFSDPSTGLGNRLHKVLTDQLDTTTGSLAGQQRFLSDRSDSLDDAIRLQNEMLSQQEQDLRNEFSAMEVALSTFQGQSSLLSSLYSGTTASTASTSSSTLSGTSAGTSI